MQVPSYKELLEAGVHFGHLKKKWNPKMAPYIFAERKGIHIIDLNKTRECMEEAGKIAKQLAKSGKKILFVATKKQARDIVSAAALSVGMPYVTDRWLGGMLTNFSIDTNADPNKVDYPIPANDDATKSIRTVTNFMVDAIREGLNEREKRKAEKEAETGAPAE